MKRLMKLASVLISVLVLLGANVNAQDNSAVKDNGSDIHNPVIDNIMEAVTGDDGTAKGESALKVIGRILIIANDKDVPSNAVASPNDRSPIHGVVIGATAGEEMHRLGSMSHAMGACLVKNERRDLMQDYRTLFGGAAAMGPR